MTPEEWYDKFVQDAKFSPLSTREVMIAIIRAAVEAKREEYALLALQLGYPDVERAIRARS